MSRRTVLAAATVAATAGPVSAGVERLDTVADRWSQLAPFIQAFGPDDDAPRPALLMFHGCGGQREQVALYADAARTLGVRSFAVDSFAPRGWGRRWAQTFVCTGARFRGAERAGDVLAAVQGVAGRPDVDAERIMLLGWSHGSWAIMDLMTMPLTVPGEAGLADPSPSALAGVRSLYLLYPWAGFTALSRTRPWVRTPAVYGVVAPRDHLARPATSRRIYDAARRAGSPVELWEPEGATHSFDEPRQANPIMRHDPDLTAESLRRFAAFAEQSLLTA
jgi:dienelactone hydrolase